MNILLIEDDPNKAKQIEAFIHEGYQTSSVTTRRSYQSGLKVILEGSAHFDLILLDMSLPTFDISTTEDGYQHKQRGGEEVLREIKRKKKTNKVIIVTQFDTFGTGPQSVSIDTLKEQLKHAFPSNYVDTVYYHAGETKWKLELKTLINRLIIND